ncbi:LuxR C-terminal-related transcriptional regulator [Ornithinimicrobium sp. F0845]|uniref:LuxR C-terminal-related transcriptional regulator n=1 Tax=Ornithinimicrobium sp. F0845 TaxID=2926412 RepID=UPI001FF3DF92|nr:LuxR C-terminal-related transcriptional regulator [Ornithinimicrobium sp. F0845]
MRLLLLARWDLAISRLVPELLGHLTVIRGDALRLSDSEAASLILIHAQSRAAAIRQVIMERAHGWCAAVVLAARAGALARDEAEFVRAFRSSSMEVTGLVAQEVFAGLQPRERHLLLCTAMEGVVTVASATELTRDPRAGEVLSALERTGFLVYRVSEGPFPEDDSSVATRFRLHPLMAELARRRLAAGGVDVQLARSTVLRAVRLQLGQGQVEAGLRRLLAIGDHEAAAEVVATHGPQVLALEDGRILDQLVAHSGGAVDEQPHAWATIACAMRLRGERASAVHWAERLLAHDAAHPGSISPLHTTCVRLLLARLGAQSGESALEHARTVIADDATHPAHEHFLPLVLLEMGVIENWAGDLKHAEEHLNRAVLECQAAQLDSLAHEARSHLALTEFMASRDRAAHDLAEQVLSGVALTGEPDSPVAARAEVVRALVRLQSLPRPDADGEEPKSAERPAAAVVGELINSAVVDDLAGRFWRRMLLARTALLQGSIADAQSFLQRSPESLGLPQHLKRGFLVEQARLSILTLDQEHLREASRDFRRGGATGESLWAEAALADLQGDVRRAADLYEAASRSVTVRQPSVRETSMVCAAQLYHYRGDQDRARSLLEAALVLAEQRGDVTPFLGWSTHGTAVGSLLKDLHRTRTTWTRDLSAACASSAGIAASMRPRVATAQELGSVDELVVAPSLSPREQEVLGELARGATYADIARNLFVSENTVKTHVSNVYVKLSAKRRSEALATARKLNLL